MKKQLTLSFLAAGLIWILFFLSFIYNDCFNSIIFFQAFFWTLIGAYEVVNLYKQLKKQCPDCYGEGGDTADGEEGIWLECPSCGVKND